jgi:hypothetical protein
LLPAGILGQCRARLPEGDTIVATSLDMAVFNDSDSFYWVPRRMPGWPGIAVISIFMAAICRYPRLALG